MRGCRLVFSLLLAAGCAPRVLDVVDPCTDASAPSPSCPAPPSLPPLLKGLVGWWPLDDGPGSGSARDHSGNSNDGTLVDLDSATAWVPGHAGSALEIAGLGYVQVPRVAGPLGWSVDSIMSQVTVSAWIYFEGSVQDQWGTALSREIGNTNRQHYHLSLSSPPETASVWFEDDLTQTSTVVSRFKWTHLAATYDGMFVRVYVNGTSVLSVAKALGTFAPDTTPLVLGANGNGPVVGVTERFPGRIDELMLWNRALTPDEIAKVAAGPPY